jgi:hypothetical protein
MDVGAQGFGPSRLKARQDRPVAQAFARSAPIF